MSPKREKTYVHGGKGENIKYYEQVCGFQCVNYAQGGCEWWSGLTDPELLFPFRVPSLNLFNTSAAQPSPAPPVRDGPVSLSPLRMLKGSTVRAWKLTTYKYDAPSFSFKESEKKRKKVRVRGGKNEFIDRV